MPKGIYQRTEYHNRISRKNGFKKGNHPKTEFKKGYKHTEEWKKKASQRMKGNRYRDGYKPWNTGIRGEQSHTWRGGISFEPYAADWTDILKEAIRQRDSYICQECGIHQDELVGRFKVLDVHHIDYDKKNCNSDNLISLCRGCHMRTNYNREYWTNYFYILLGVNNY